MSNVTNLSVKVRKITIVIGKDNLTFFIRILIVDWNRLWRLRFTICGRRF